MPSFDPFCLHDQVRVKLLYFLFSFYFLYVLFCFIFGSFLPCSGQWLIFILDQSRIVFGFYIHIDCFTAWIWLFEGPFSCFETGYCAYLNVWVTDLGQDLGVQVCFGTWCVDSSLPQVWIVMRFTLELSSLLYKARPSCNPNKNDCFEFGCLHGCVTFISDVETFI